MARRMMDVRDIVTYEDMSEADRARVRELCDAGKSFAAAIKKAQAESKDGDESLEQWARRKNA